MKMNPNDPEENPEAFMLAMGGRESNSNFRQAQSPLHVNSNMSVSAGKHHAERKSRHSPSTENASRNQDAWSHRRIRSESLVNRSNFDYSQQKPGMRQAKSEYNKDVNNGRYAFSGTGHPRHKSTGSSIPDDNKHNISQSVPKFGDWDERDPKSGERFTAIFNKVKEERQVGSSNLAPVAQRPSNYPDSQAAKHEGVKVCCCLFSRK
ncbi:RPM1-interacting protein 4-like [Carica papaya]|uniref:RPM1-interacting protein 4-like n=1 Tax=Carica papaya TaxID=3649 RepID=UPI000B8D17CE|nr:RPM1-interacting protein 4-like [Carica papaya]